MVIFDSFIPAEGSPIYQQIIRHIQQGLVAGTISKGDELPSRRTLSALLGVNPNTIQKAYRILEEEGVLASHAGAKSFVTAGEETVEQIRRQLLTNDTRALVHGLRQMGVSLADALTEVERLWDLPQTAERDSGGEDET